MQKKNNKNERNKTRIQNFLNAIDWLFQVNNFEKEIIFKEKDDPDREIAAQILFREDYQDITVYIYPCFLKEPKDKQRKILLHELCHSITIPTKTALYDFIDGKFVTPERIRELNEQETSKIENILDGLLRGRLRYAKAAYENYLK